MFTQKKNKYKYQMYRKLCLETTRNNIVELKAMFNIAISWELNCKDTAAVLMKLCQIILRWTYSDRLLHIPFKLFCGVFYLNNKYWLVDTAKFASYHKAGINKQFTSETIQMTTDYKYITLHSLIRKDKLLYYLTWSVFWY